MKEVELRELIPFLEEARWPLENSILSFHSLYSSTFTSSEMDLHSQNSAGAFFVFIRLVGFSDSSVPLDTKTTSSFSFVFLLWHL